MQLASIAVPTSATVGLVNVTIAGRQVGAASGANNKALVRNHQSMFVRDRTGAIVMTREDVVSSSDTSVIETKLEASRSGNVGVFVKNPPRVETVEIPEIPIRPLPQRNGYEFRVHTAQEFKNAVAQAVSGDVIIITAFDISDSSEEVVTVAANNITIKSDTNMFPRPIVQLGFYKLAIAGNDVCLDHVSMSAIGSCSVTGDRFTMMHGSITTNPPVVLIGDDWYFDDVELRSSAGFIVKDCATQGVMRNIRVSAWSSYWGLIRLDTDVNTPQTIAGWLFFENITYHFDAYLQWNFRPDFGCLVNIMNLNAITPDDMLGIYVKNVKFSDALESLPLSAVQPVGTYTNQSLVRVTPNSTRVPLVFKALVADTLSSSFVGQQGLVHVSANLPPDSEVLRVDVSDVINAMYVSAANIAPPMTDAEPLYTNVAKPYVTYNPQKTIFGEGTGAGLVKISWKWATTVGFSSFA
jgi:hypothetical protein